jgi:acyl-CoA dehydrogenase
MNPLEQALRQILKGSIEAESSCSGMEAWFLDHQRLCADATNSLVRATLGGARFRQLSFAFASAYQSALENMFGTERFQQGALCHNEKGVKKPREMTTRITSDAEGNAVVSGHKGFVSGGANANKLYVSAVDTRDGSGKIKMLQLEPGMKGLTLSAGSSLPFLPELDHAKLTLEGVVLADENILKDDGYTDYVKPFRTEEDLHILAALLGQRLNIAIALRQTNFIEQALTLISALKTAYDADRSSELAHLTLADIKQQCIALFNEQDKFLQQETSMHSYLKAWERDRALLAIAESAQQARTKKARAYFGLED